MNCRKLEAAGQTNGVSESDVKELIKKQLKNAPKTKKAKKTQMIQMIGLIRPMLIKIWNCIRRNHFLEPNIRSP